MLRQRSLHGRLLPDCQQRGIPATKWDAGFIAISAVGASYVTIAGFCLIQIWFDESGAVKFGIALALVPLLIFTSDSKLMGDLVNSKRVKQTGWVIVVLVVALNIWLLVGTALGL